VTTRRMLIVGLGNIGTALLKGLLGARGIEPQKITVLVRRDEQAKKAAQYAGVGVTLALGEAMKAADIIFLCVKSSQAVETVRCLSDHMNGAQKPTVVSLCAGVPVSELEQATSSKAYVVKAIANINMETKDGYTVIYNKYGSDLPTLADLNEHLNAVGTVVYSKSELECDIVSTMSATIPAFIALTLSGLKEAGVYCGVRKELAAEIATTVMRQTAETIAKLDTDPETYRNMVTSPGGVVIKGVHVLEEYKLRAAYVHALDTVQKLVLNYQEQGRIQKER
jgi:pyrroline-5-carboxylate reductase